MEESENNICTHCNTKDLTDLSNHNREVHIKSCKKKIEKSNQKVNITPKNRSLNHYWKASGSNSSNSSSVSNSTVNLDINNLFAHTPSTGNPSSTNSSPSCCGDTETINSIDCSELPQSSTLTNSNTNRKKRRLELGNEIIIQQYCTGFKPKEFNISNFPFQLMVGLSVFSLLQFQENL